MSISASRLVIAASALLFSTAAAHADAIDGTWCSSDSRHFAIEGPDISTPGGNRVIGDYQRHAFHYVVPDGEPEAGSDVNMVLVDKETIHLRIGADAAAPIEVWRRCQLTT